MPQRTAAPSLARTGTYGQRPVVTRPQATYGSMVQRPAAQRPGLVRPAAPQPMTARPSVPQRPAERPSAPRFLTVAEVAGIMRVSKMTVYRLVHGGELAAVRVGRSFRVPEPAVREYLADARTDVA
jgi:excisionase family DNA binding protein